VNRIFVEAEGEGDKNHATRAKDLRGGSKNRTTETWAVEKGNRMTK